MDNVIQSSGKQTKPINLVTEKSDKVDLMGMIQSATVKYKQNAEPSVTTPITPGKKGFLDLIS